MAKQERGIVWKTHPSGLLRLYVRLFIDGRQQWFLPPQQTLASARAYRDKLLTEYRERRFNPERYHTRGGAKVQEFIDRYLPYASQERKPTGPGERSFAQWWSRWYAGKTLAHVTPSNLRLAQEALLAGQWPRYAHKPRPRSPARVNRYTQWLHQVFAHPVNREFLTHGNPVGKHSMKKYHEAEPPVITISDEQEEAILAILQDRDPMAAKFFRLAIMTGMRSGELFKRPKSDVQLREGRIVIRKKKAPNAKVKRPRYIPLTEEGLEIVAAFIKTPGEWLIPHPKDPARHFPILDWSKTVFRGILRELKISDEVTWHTLRHTWATRFLERGKVNMRELQEAGGWDTLSMVQRYAHVDDDRIREAMERAAQKPAKPTVDPVEIDDDDEGQEVA